MSEEDQGTTRLVRLKKHRGEVQQDCDVYIGPRVKNRSWDLEESEWWNPYSSQIVLRNGRKRIPNHQEMDYKNEQFRKYVLASPKLCKKLPDLLGKTLGCLCSGDFKNCHGRVLVNLVNNLDGKEKIAAEVRSHGTLYRTYDGGRGVVFFKGGWSPFSNYFPCTIVMNDPCSWSRGSEEEEGERVVFRLGTFQGYAWKCARLRGADERAKQILGCSSFTALNSLSRDYEEECTKPMLTLDQQICIMYGLIKAKVEQVPDVRTTYCSKLFGSGKRVLLCEATSSDFWGIGTDYSHLMEKLRLIFPLRNKMSIAYNQYSLGVNVFRGLNLLGWLIKIVLCERKIGSDSFADVMSLAFEEGEGDSCPELMKRGLHLIIDTLQANQMCPPELVRAYEECFEGEDDQS